VNAAPNPADPTPPAAALSAAADRARAQLHEEIERLRVGVEEMLAEQAQPIDPQLRRELDDMREEVRLYVRKRMKKSERKVERSLERVEARTSELEQRIDRVEAEREEAEVRIYGETERLLDGLLQEVKTVADLFERPAVE
jgi:F0F1-type ATP synthase membrane subunit b/b'